jgi:hypothetical protein
MTAHGNNRVAPGEVESGQTFGLTQNGSYVRIAPRGAIACVRMQHRASPRERQRDDSDECGPNKQGKAGAAALPLAMESDPRVRMLPRGWATIMSGSDYPVECPSCS